VSASKPSFASATDAGPSGSYTKYCCPSRGVIMFGRSQPDHPACETARNGGALGGVEPIEIASEHAIFALRPRELAAALARQADPHVRLDFEG
jgi:hypothetical protein